MNHRLSAGADSIGAGAPADEIEITPAMLQAGEEAFYVRLCALVPPSGTDTVTEACRAIFLAMRQAQHKASP